MINLNGNTHYMPWLDRVSFPQTLRVANALRNKGYSINTGTEQESIVKALKTANKLDYKKVFLYGDKELNNKELTVKDMESGDQTTISL